MWYALDFDADEERPQESNVFVLSGYLGQGRLFSFNFHCVGVRGGIPSHQSLVEKIIERDRPTR